MNSVRSRKKELYYTKDHEWIDFQGLVAFVGVCSFKLLGFNQIQQIVFANYPDFKKQGEVIATINYKDCKIQVNMPVDGKIIDLNKKLLTGKPNILLQAAEKITHGLLS